METHTGHVMNLANSIIGVSLLAMPFCFKQCGITLAIIMLFLSSIISRLACHFLVKSSTMCRRRNFEFLAFYTFGPSGKLLVEIGVIGFMMGTCVAFFVVMGDLGPAIISKIFNISNSNTLRTSVLIGLSLLVVLPLGLLRNVESLAAISTITIGFYFLFILKIFFESSPRLFNGDWLYHVNFWQPEGILQCIPIFAMALSCQTQLFEIYDSLPMPTIEKMNSVVRSALNLCTVVYASVGFLGYIAYCKGSFSGNILLSFTPSLSSEMFKLGFVMSIAVSFPLVIFPCRASLFSLMFKRVPIHHELSQTNFHIPDSRFKVLTIGIVSVALVTGLLIPSIELVLGFVGSTIGIAICVIFPSLSFLNLNNKNTSERLMAKITLCMGLIIMIMGTFGNLFAAVENRPVEPGRLINSKTLPQIKPPLAIDVSTEIPSDYNKGLLLPQSLTPEKSLLVESPASVKAKGKLSKNQRKEPPVPVAPDSKNKGNHLRPQIQIIETRNKSVPRKSEPNPLPEAYFNEIINRDAIEKENREILEMEKQKKVDEDEKQQELLKKLREHQDEQKKLLREQEKILIEIKHRENEKKSMESLKEKSIAKEIPKKEEKTAERDQRGEFKSNIDAGQINGKVEKSIDAQTKSRVNGTNSLSNWKPDGVDGPLKNGIPSGAGVKHPDSEKPDHKKWKSAPEESPAKELWKASPLPTNASLLEKTKESRSAAHRPSSESKQEVLGHEILLEKKAEKEPARKKRSLDARRLDPLAGGCIDGEKASLASTNAIGEGGQERLIKTGGLS